MGPSIIWTMVWFGREQHVLSRRGPEVTVIVDIVWLSGCSDHFGMEIGHCGVSEKDHMGQLLIMCWPHKYLNVIK